LGVGKSHFGGEKRGFWWLSNGFRWVSDGFFSMADRLFSTTSLVEALDIFYLGENAARAAIRSL
jgi:hypothetical protein